RAHRLVTGRKKLESLDLADNLRLRDEDLTELLSFPNLRSLSLSGVSVTDAGVLPLGRLSKLQIVDLSRNHQITDKGLTSLQKLALRRLDLSWAKEVSDTGLATLAKIKTLEELSLSGTKVSDKGLAHLRSLTALSDLDLRRTSVLGNGLDVLADLPLCRLS